MTRKKLPPMHPGGILREEFRVRLGLSPYAVAKACGVPRTRIERLAREEIGVSGETAVRLAALFGTTGEFRIRYELETAQVAVGAEAGKIERFRGMAT